jgi:hypothetical protein
MQARIQKVTQELLFAKHLWNWTWNFGIWKTLQWVFNVKHLAAWPWERGPKVMNLPLPCQHWIQTQDLWHDNHYTTKGFLLNQIKSIQIVFSTVERNFRLECSLFGSLSPLVIMITPLSRIVKFFL